jgi:hypothetical protein
MSLKSTFNIAGLTLIITCDEKAYAQASQIRGKVILRGGEYQQHARSVAFQLREFWPETTYVPGGNPPRPGTVTAFKNHQTLMLATATTIVPRSEAVFDFSVQLPPNCRLSGSNSGWRITVDVDIPNALDAKADLVLEVVPSEEMTAFINTVVGRLQFKADESSWDWENGVTRQRLLPPRALRSKLRHVWFEMERVNAGLAVEALFDLQAKSAVDYLKTFFARNPTSRKSARRKFNLSAEQIWTSNHQPNVERILGVLVPLLEDVVETQA